MKARNYPQLLPSKVIVEMLLSNEAVRVNTPFKATHFSSVKAGGKELNVYVRRLNQSQN